LDCSAILALTEEQKAAIIQLTRFWTIRNLTFEGVQGIDNHAKAEALFTLFAHLRSQELSMDSSGNFMPGVILKDTLSKDSQSFWERPFYLGA